jgi:hypothetical protein
MRTNFSATSYVENILSRGSCLFGLLLLSNIVDNISDPKLILIICEIMCALLFTFQAILLDSNGDEKQTNFALD